MIKLTITLKNGVTIDPDDKFDIKHKSDIFLALANSFEKDGAITATDKNGLTVNAKFSDVKSITVDFD